MAEFNVTDPRYLMEPRQGVIIAAYLTLIIAIMNLIVGLIALYRSMNVPAREQKDRLMAIGHACLAGFIILAILSWLLFKAVEKNKPNYTIPWLLVHALDIIFGLQLTIQDLIAGQLRRVIEMVLLAIEIYIWILVFKFFAQGGDPYYYPPAAIEEKPIPNGTEPPPLQTEPPLNLSYVL